MPLYSSIVHADPESQRGRRVAKKGQEKDNLRFYADPESQQGRQVTKKRTRKRQQLALLYSSIIMPGNSGDFLKVTDSLKKIRGTRFKTQVLITVMSQCDTKEVAHPQE